MICVRIDLLPVTQSVLKAFQFVLYNVERQLLVFVHGKDFVNLEGQQRG